MAKTLEKSGYCDIFSKRGWDVKHYTITQIVNKHKYAALLPKTQITSLNLEKHHSMTIIYHHTFKKYLRNESQMSQDFYHLRAIKVTQ